MSEVNKSVFETLREVGIKEKVEEKIGLKYLSWANAWTYLKQTYPDAFYTVYTRDVVLDDEYSFKDATGNERKITKHSVSQVPYFTDGETCYVKVGVTIEEIEYVEYLPVMDNRNNSIPLSSITMTAVNKAVQRAFVKACARHGLGIALYAGEDLPEDKKTAFVDFSALENKVMSENFGLVDNFQEMSNKIIAKIQGMKYDKSTNDKIVGCISKFLNGKRVSQLSADVQEDVVTLQRINAFIAGVEDLLK